MASYRNIVFDLGGVLLDINYQLAIDAFEQLGFPKFENMYSQFSADQLFSKLEKGEVSPDTFYEVMQKAGREGLTRQQVKHAWNSLILSFRSSSIEYLRTLQSSYSIYLLSNTNKIHHEYFSRIFEGEIGYGKLESLFLKAYLSFEIGMRKPDREIYDYVIRDAGINPMETLFIDDSLPNIEAAKALGWGVHWLRPGERIEALGL
jgi:putative hydrolase of the HAD superfamily